MHQKGLVHVSALANRFVKDPHEVVKPGQIVKVKVLEVDLKRQRVALSMRLDDAPAAAPHRGGAGRVRMRRIHAPHAIGTRPKPGVTRCARRGRAEKLDPRVPWHSRSRN